MFQPSTTNILPIVNPSVTQNLKLSSPDQNIKEQSFEMRKWLKWGLLSAGGLAATAAVIYGGPMIFTALMTGVAAKLSGDGQGNALAPFEPSNMLMANPVDLALPTPQGGLNKDDWLTEFIGSTSEELPEYLKDTIKEQSADLDEAELADLDEEKTLDDLERDHVLAEPPSAKTDTDITELLLPAVIEKQRATSLKLTEFEELPTDPISKQQSKRSPTELFPEVIELSSLTGATGFKLDGEAAGDLSGVSVASAGDINGDSIDDLIVGAHYADPSGRGDAGRSYVVFGHTGAWASPIELSSLTGTTGFKLDGEAADDRSGYSVSSAGDINEVWPEFVRKRVTL